MARNEAATGAIAGPPRHGIKMGSKRGVAPPGRKRRARQAFHARARPCRAICGDRPRPFLALPALAALALALSIAPAASAQEHDHMMADSGIVIAHDVPPG